MQLIEGGAAAWVYFCDNWEGSGTLGFVEGKCAVKVHRDDCKRARDELRRELRALRRIAAKTDDGPSFIVNLLFVDAVTVSSQPVLGLEFCEGGDLYSLMSYGAITERDVKCYAVELAIALDHMHRAGIFHGDLKPENIGLTAAGHFRVFDFGTSRVLENGMRVAHCAGTLGYASPEALQRTGCDFAADWWAFGVIVYEMLVGQHAFDTEGAHEAVDYIIAASVRWPDHPWRSELAKDFVHQFVVPNGEARMQTLAACLAHSFVADVDLDSIVTESWQPLKFAYAKFAKEKIVRGNPAKSFF